VTVTNDAWFGTSAAASQHFSMVVFRSVENHLAFARSANTGISGFIDPFGRIIEATPVFTEQAAKATVQVWRPDTFYSRHGDVFGWTCVGLSALAILRRTSLAWSVRQRPPAQRLPKRSACA